MRVFYAAGDSAPVIAPLLDQDMPGGLTIRDLKSCNTGATGHLQGGLISSNGLDGSVLASGSPKF